jgi:hypothetical protein
MDEGYAGGYNQPMEMNSEVMAWERSSWSVAGEGFEQCRDGGFRAGCS